MLMRAFLDQKQKTRVKKTLYFSASADHKKNKHITCRGLHEETSYRSSHNTGVKKAHYFYTFSHHIQNKCIVYKQDKRLLSCILNSRIKYEAISFRFEKNLTSNYNCAPVALMGPKSSLYFYFFLIPAVCPLKVSCSSLLLQSFDLFHSTKGWTGF